MTAGRGIRALCALALAVSGLLWIVPGALGAPANDDFANREVLNGSLPIEVTRSNVEATKESGEFLGSIFAAGHSVWFEWEAASDDWITIGACNSDFANVAGVYTGTAVNSLTSVSSGNSSEGPDCPFSQRQYTFKATTGTKYEIAVDGNPFHMPEAPTPDTEGVFDLRIEETPPPSNDDFADAAVLEAPIDEEPGGDRFYFAHAQGYNWKATTEAGEPFYGANSGASVWYSWTAPESGKYLFGGPCCGSGLNWSLYTGNAIDGLSSVLAATGSAEVTVPAGTTFWIAVWGTPDLATEEPTMGGFQFNISARLPPLPPSPAGDGDAGSPPRDLIAPDTRIRRSVLKRRPPILTFHFESTEPGSTFRCKLDRQPYRKCGSGKRYAHLGSGPHTLKVFAVDPAGNADPFPAVARFRIPERTKPR
jgi:hypothetical protein